MHKHQAAVVSTHCECSSPEPRLSAVPPEALPPTWPCLLTRAVSLVPSLTCCLAQPHRCGCRRPAASPCMGCLGGRCHPPLHPIHCPSLNRCHCCSQAPDLLQGELGCCCQDQYARVAEQQAPLCCCLELHAWLAVGLLLPDQLLLQHHLALSRLPLQPWRLHLPPGPPASVVGQ